MLDHDTDPDVYHEWSLQTIRRVIAIPGELYIEDYPVAKHKSYRKRPDGSIYDVRVEHIDPATHKPME